MAKRKKNAPAKPEFIEPNPPQPRMILVATFAVLVAGWLGYLLVIAIVAANQ